MTANLDVEMEHVRMCLAEAGYPGTYVWYDYERSALCIAETVPPAVAWTAFYIADLGIGYKTGRQVACWTCWSQFIYEIREDCEQFRCHNPDKPRRPPRELLGHRDPLYTYTVK